MAGHEIMRADHMGTDAEEESMTGQIAAAPDASGDTSGPSDAEGDGAKAAGEPSDGPTLAGDAEQSIADAIAKQERRVALSRCARHHGAAIGRLCMALVGSQAEAEDLTQETLLDAHDGFDGWRGEGSIRSWLMAIARRKCARHLERRSRRQERLRLVHDSERPATDDMVELHRRAERARSAIGRIRPSEREALVLRYVGELSFREVGEALSIDEAAARKRVSRAVAHLRDALVHKE
jgi:RNA polymerase sigma-70 factor (ECF subfamily)